MRLSLYLLKLVGGRILAALAVLVGILQILDLLDVTTDILDRRLGAAGVLYYALLRLPRLIEQAAPLAVLAGALFAFSKLANESAITAMRSTGISAYRITALALPAAAAIALAQLAIGQVIAPRTDEMLTEWWQASAPPKDRAKMDEPVTFRLGSEIVTAKLDDPDGGRLSDVVIYQRDASGRLTQRTSANTAVYDGRMWQLISPHFEMLAPLSVKEGAAAKMSWIQNLRPADIQTLMANQPTVTPSEAQRALEGGVAIRPRTFYDTQVQRAWAGPAACLVMLLLAAPAALANFRGGAATMLTQSLAAGLLFLVVDGAFTALGENGAAPAVLAAWAAPAMFAALGLTALLYREG
jgi:lipopolysaccharide export system permease protein